MTIVSITELRGFLSQLEKIEPIADFGGYNKHSITKIRAVMKEFGIGKYYIYDIKGGDFKMDLTKETVKEKYQTIICFETLEHVTDPFALAENIMQALVGGGYAIISAPFVWGEHSSKDYFRFTKYGLRLIFKGMNFVREKYVRESSSNLDTRSLLIFQKPYA